LALFHHTVLNEVQSVLQPVDQISGACTEIKSHANSVSVPTIIRSVLGYCGSEYRIAL